MLWQVADMRLFRTAQVLCLLIVFVSVGAVAASKVSAAILSDDGAIALGPLHAFWRTTPTGGAVPTSACKSELMQELPAWQCNKGANATVPLTGKVAMVRLLGGLKDKHGSPTTKSDVAQRSNRTGELTYHWELLHARITPLLGELDLGLVLVLDNVPWAFVSDQKKALGFYGNVHGPDNVTEYGEFLAELVQELVSEYIYMKL